MKLLATLGAVLFSGTVLATPLHNIVVFGDSLSDNGNLYEVMKHQLPPSPPYFEGRFSNGPVWIEHLVKSYFPNNPSAHLLDYAYGGAGVSEDAADEELFTLKREINNYFLGHNDKADPDSLYIVWIGSNNYLGLPEDVEKTLNDVNQGITHGVQELVKKGAKHIMVVNIPDLGRTPAAIEFENAETLTHFSQEHNRALESMMAQLKYEHSDVEWLFFDMNTSFTKVLEHPEEYGLTNVTGTCANTVASNAPKSVVRLSRAVTLKAKAKSDGCDGYLFFDLVHPSAQGHQVLADGAKKVLDEAGIVFSE